MRPHPGIQPLPLQPGQIGTGVLRTRQDDPVIHRQFGPHAGLPHRHQLYATQGGQRLELIQIADARRHQQGNPRRRTHRPVCRACAGHLHLTWAGYAVVPPGTGAGPGVACTVTALGGSSLRCLPVHVTEGTSLCRLAAPIIGGTSLCRLPVAVLEPAILLRQAVAGPHRHGGHHRHTGHLQHPFGGWREQTGIPPETVQHEAAQAPAVVFGHQRPGAVQMGKGTAAVDVGHQQADGIGVARHPQVHHIAGLQVDLGRRPGPLDDDHIVLAAQVVQRLCQQRPDFGTAGPPGHAGQPGIHLPQQHHLAARVGFGLEQQRVHLHRGLHARGQRLKILRAADLAPRHHASIVAHVLRLEGRHPQPLPRIPAAQCRHQPALARPATGAQHHDAAGQPASGVRRAAGWGHPGFCARAGLNTCADKVVTAPGTVLICLYTSACIRIGAILCANAGIRTSISLYARTSHP